MDYLLTDDRICERCTVERVDSQHVRLHNRRGEAATYRVDEVLGEQRHPWLTRWFVHSIRAQGVNGLPGRIIVPQAFDDTTRWLPQSQGLPMLNTQRPQP